MALAWEPGGAPRRSHFDPWGPHCSSEVEKKASLCGVEKSPRIAAKGRAQISGNLGFQVENRVTNFPNVVTKSLKIATQSMINIDSLPENSDLGVS